MISSRTLFPTHPFVEFPLADINQTIAQRFEQQACRYPERLAVKAGKRSLTYDELNATANGVAHAILGRAGAATHQVAILCNADVSMIVAILGALKTGKAFAPLNPQLPKIKLHEIFATLGSCLVLSDENNFAAAMEIAGGVKQVLNVDALDRHLCRENLELSVSPDALAYINFTSGSTGAPKGVMWNHRCELFGIRTKTNALHIAPTDRVSLLRANNVGAARDMFLALLNGAALIVLDLGAGGLATLGDWLRGEDISVFTCVATVFRQSVSGAGGTEKFPAVRLVHIGGEPIYKTDMDLFHRHFSDGCLLVSRYSISETQAVSYFFMNQDTKIHGDHVPVGYPLEGNEVLILDDDGRETAAGTMGEIAVRSPYLALGYWGQPDLTRAKFLDNFQGAGTRTYLTGDLGYRLPDGCLIQAGRKDFQAKIKGFKVEVTAVEAALNEIPSVRRAVVVARQDAAKGSRLIAYVVPQDPAAAGVSQLRTQLKSRLPAYMIPDSFVMTESLPLNSGGKVDRSALPALEGNQRAVGTTFVEPRDAVEEALVIMWRDVLNLDTVGIDDDFTQLGGDSLVAARLVTKIAGLFPLQAPLTNLYATPTVAELAKFITDHESQPGQAQKIAAVFLQVEAMSDAEVQHTVQNPGGPRAMAEGQAESARDVLDTARRELLTGLLKKDGIELPATRLLAEDTSGEGTLSFSQERLWFLDQLYPGSPVYNISRALRLKGRLNRQAIGKGINEIVRRHETLRSSFPSVDDKPVQTVAPEVSIPLPLIDLKRLPQPRRPAEMARLLNAEAAAPFDLARGPLIRANLIQLADNHHVLLLVLHQMVCDGWSMSLFLRELETCYRSLVAKRKFVLPELPIQYGAYAYRQKQLIQDSALQSQLSYWQDRLSNSTGGVALATDHRRPNVQSFRGARLPLAIPKALLRALKALSAEEGTTLFMTLMAAFDVLLWRYSSQDDICVGFPVANRSQTGTENLMGLFVNTLVLRTDLSGSPTFRELLRRVRIHCNGALAHQDLPFDQLVEELHLERDLGRNPLFDVMLAYQNYPAAELKLPGLQVEALDLTGSTAKFALTLSLTERDAELRGFFEYSTDLFDRPTIERMARHLLTLLRSITAHPEDLIGDVALLSKRDREQILVRWNRTAAIYPKDRCIHELFEAQVARTPRATAVECAGQTLTYRELNRRANQLARYLRKLGVGPDKLVGVCLERSLDLVIALLGILKAGGAYVPLDPKYPPARIAFMLDDAKVSALISRKKVIEDGRRRMKDRDLRSLRLRSGQPSIFDPRLTVVCLDRDAAVIRRQSGQNLRVRMGAQDLAYVIYTSGSTGEPKGAAIEHRNVAAFLCWAKRVFSAEQLAGVLASTSICFDLSVFELFAPLCWGGKAIVVDNALALHDLAGANKVTLVNTVPSAISEMLDLGALPPSVRTVNLAGEPLKTELVERIYETAAVKKVYDLYGPSETTTYSTFTLRGKKTKATIGRPIANTRIYLLDGALQPVPIGVAGEIFIGGAGVARGYLNRPQLTAEKFLRDPFARGAKARMYRTGDLARYDAHGDIEYLGRVDNQIKIRGYRIELGEIEAALNRHPAVRESVVMARDSVDETLDLSNNPKSKIENPKLTRQLVAYLVFNGSMFASGSELRSVLCQTLPEYMVPAVFVPLDGLPLTPNGKVDRHALPSPDGGLFQSIHDYVAPRTESEELIAQTWREVLKFDRIGVHDNFFELGGHSLLAARVAGRLRTNFNVDLPLRRIFELPTVALLGAEIDRLCRSARGVTTPPIVPVRRDDPIPLSCAQRRVWFLHKLDADLSAYNMPVSHRVRGPLNITALEASLNEIVRRHETLRTAIAEVDGEPVQQIQTPACLDLDVIDLRQVRLEQAEKEAERIFNDDARQPFDMSQAPLIRAKLLRLGAEDFFLILNFHHLICDGSSLAIFYRELALIYDAALSEKRAALPAIAAHYADFAAWQEDWLQSDASAPQVTYWKHQLGSGLRLLNLPTDYVRPGAQTYRGARGIKRLSKELTDALKQLSRQQGATLFMTLLAALKILLSRLAGQDDVVVGSTVAGRNRPELDGLIGFFINAVVLRTDLSGNPTFVELLARVRETCLDAYTHQDLPFERVVEAINPGRDLSRNPIFQVLFNMADVAERELVLTGCETERISQVAPGAKFDLVFQAPQADSRIELTVVYNADLFSEARMTALIDQWRSLLSQAASEPNKKIEQFTLMTALAKTILPNPEERLDETGFGTIPSLVLRQAEKSPEKDAVADEDASWTYQELDAASSRLAGLLIDQHIQPRDVVAIYAHRDATLALAILGVLKAGAVFVILDPAYPAARLLDYLRIAQPKGWIHMASAGAPPQELSRFFGTTEISNRIDLPRARQEITRLLKRDPGRLPEIALAAEDPAYIAFTSGSTGQPKGVLCRHGPITHFLPWQEETFELKNSDRYSLLSGLGYNHLQRELFTALASGATVYVPGEKQLKDAEQLVHWLQRCEISILHLTPALGRLLRTARSIQLPSARRLFFGGDLLTRRDVDAMHEAAPNADIISFYGATETQRAVGYFVIPKKLLAPGGVSLETIPTGTGVKDVQLLLLNARRQLAGVGELGEIFVRSPHLAAGYVGDDALTSANFMTNPFTNDGRDRLYRTGELGRYLPDGNVEWAGRRDRRVSVRGFRVELAEVEAALGQHARIRHAAVAAQEFASGDAAAVKETRLVAYVEPDKDDDLGADDLRAFLSVRLPHYMIPSYFHSMDRLPISPNGKVDYFSLPAVEDRHRESRIFFEAPRTAMEQRLGKIFADVLGVKRVGRLDNFFELGGHSLLAVQAAARIRETLQMNLDLRTFLQAPTVAMLAKRFESAESSTDAGIDPRVIEREEIEL